MHIIFQIFEKTLFKKKLFLHFTPINYVFDLKDAIHYEDLIISPLDDVLSLTENRNLKSSYLNLPLINGVCDVPAAL